MICPNAANPFLLYESIFNADAQMRQNDSKYSIADYVAMCLCLNKTILSDHKKDLNDIMVDIVTNLEFYFYINKSEMLFAS